MPTFETKYTDDQREAAAVAYLDRRIKPAQRVSELAARGELQLNGAALDPFDIPADAVRSYASRLRKARAGQLKSGLTDVHPRDAVESLRIRLVSAADHMLLDVEKRQRANKPNAKDPELLRQIGRAVREIAAIPAKDDARPVAPGQKIPGAGNKTNGGSSSGGLAGSILAAHQGGPVYTPPQEGPQQSPTQDQDQDGDNGATHSDIDLDSATANDAPGSWMREQVSRLAG